MKKLKNLSFKMILCLVVTAVAVGGALAGFYQLVSPRIEANRLADEKRAIFSVIDGAAGYDTTTVEVADGAEMVPVSIFTGFDSEGNVLGFAFLAKGAGFAGTISMMVGLNIDKEHLSGLKVIEQIETPGLGNKIAMEPFQGQFRGLLIRPKITYVKNKKAEKENEIQAITGATISSVVVVKTINETLEMVLPIIEEHVSIEQRVIEKAEEGVEGVEGDNETDASEPPSELPNDKAEGEAETQVKDKAKAEEADVEAEDGDRDNDGE